MKKIRTANVISFFTVLIAVAVSILVNTFSNDILDFETPNEGNTVGSITMDKKMEQTFLSEKNGLNRIDILFATYARINTSNVLIEVKDDIGNLLFSKNISSDKINDNEFYTVRFDPIKDSQGKEYHILISSDTAEYDNAVTVWASVLDSYTSGAFYINGADTGYDIAIRAFYSSLAYSAGIRILCTAAVVLSAALAVIFMLTKKRKQEIKKWIIYSAWIICSLLLSTGAAVLYYNYYRKEFDIASLFSKNGIIVICLLLVPCLLWFINIFLGAENISKITANTNDIFIVGFIFIFGIVFHYFLSDFDNKILEIYPDEYFYWNIARNLYNGYGIIDVNDNLEGFSKIAYSVILAPFFAISDMDSRMTCIAIFNSVLMMSSLFPIWLIAKHLKIERKHYLIFLAIISVWPDLITSMTFMTENLYWPILLTFIYIWLKNSDRCSIKYAAAEGILCYIGYMCKDIFLAVLVACIGWEICYPVIDRIIAPKGSRKGLKSIFSRKRFINLAVVMLCFTVMYFIGKSTILSRIASPGGSSYYLKLDNYTLAYFIYSCLYYFSAIMLSVFILPVVLPLVNIHKLTERTRKLFCYVLILLAVQIVVVSYLISIRETLGLIRLRILMRYLSPSIPVIILCFIKSLENTAGSYPVINSLQWVIATICSMGVCILYSGTFKGSPSDQSLLNWYEKIENKVGSLTIGVEALNVNLYKIIIGLFVIILSLLCLYLFNKGKNGIIRRIYLILCLGMCVISNITEYRENRFNREVDGNIINDVQEVTEFLNHNAGKNVLYITDYRYSKLQMTFDTYVNDEKSIYIVSFDDILTQCEAGVAANVNNISFHSIIRPAKIMKPETIDYIVTNKYIETNTPMFDNTEMVMETDQEYYKVYENLDNKTITCHQDNIA